MGKLEISCENEYIYNVKGKTDGIVKDFQDAGGSVTPMPQIFLSRVGDRFGGRCYAIPWSARWLWHRPQDLEALMD